MNFLDWVDKHHIRKVEYENEEFTFYFKRETLINPNEPFTRYEFLKDSELIKDLDSMLGYSF